MIAFCVVCVTTCDFGDGLSIVALPATTFAPWGRAHAAPETARQTARLRRCRAKRRPTTMREEREVLDGFMRRSLEVRCDRWEVLAWIRRTCSRADRRAGSFFGSVTASPLVCQASDRRIEKLFGRSHTAPMPMPESVARLTKSGLRGEPSFAGSCRKRDGADVEEESERHELARDPADPRLGWQEAQSRPSRSEACIAGSLAGSRTHARDRARRAGTARWGRGSGARICDFTD